MLRVSKLGPRPEGGESGGPISNLSAQHSSPIFHKLIRLRARISKGQRMVGYTITEKWWWKKLLEEIKWELLSFHPETSSCHSEPFDGLPETTLGTGRTGSAKNLCGPPNYEILRRPAYNCAKWH